MNNNPFTDILSGIVGVCITCLFNHFSNRYKAKNHTLDKTIKVVSNIQRISSDFKNVYRSKILTNNKRAQVSLDLTQINIISLHILSKKLDAHLLLKLCKQDLNWIHDYLNVTYTLYNRYAYVICNYNKAYKKLFRFHKKDDKYEIKTY